MADGQETPERLRVSIEISPEAITAGGKAGGAYLDKIGKFDLTKLTKEEFHRFNTTVIVHAMHFATHDALSGFIRRLESNGNIITDQVPG